MLGVCSEITASEEKFDEQFKREEPYGGMSYSQQTKDLTRGETRCPRTAFPFPTTRPFKGILLMMMLLMVVVMMIVIVMMMMIKHLYAPSLNLYLKSHI
ncbi:hypothetical protein DPMN_182281 [Dreissena polymorpha]|uniref:Uncharacterized protein n=1 Tax=Dreissena polymorpha TaxID=45954 RepID=A0A9D4I4I4_DREPO|nr:hypothetical protein DPMN_182281 [Dreissena polymorpha]